MLSATALSSSVYRGCRETRQLEAEPAGDVEDVPPVPTEG